MGAYIIRRCLGAIPTLFFTSILIYGILLAAPGGPEARFLSNPKITPDQIAAMRHRWGLDQPVPIQYCRWLGVCNPDGEGLGIFLSDTGLPNILPQFLGGGDNGIVHLDFGFSTDLGRPVTSVICARLLPTAILAGTPLVVWILIAFITGVTAAVKRYSKTDTAITIFNYVGYSLPTFWLGIMLIIVFAAHPEMAASGRDVERRAPRRRSGPTTTGRSWRATPLQAFTDMASHLILPVITLVAVNVAGDWRFIRASMLDTLNQDYVRTARAKGVPETGDPQHALRNALLP